MANNPSKTQAIPPESQPFSYVRDEDQEAIFENSGRSHEDAVAAYQRALQVVDAEISKRKNS